ncbi:hydroxymethylbilane synthase [Sphingomonas xinjiangensis]|uniref:Porphobilinogen deaminase n=1 Tax=Sphingomonas xinjiangensis TaxID=643568 RepID=A0A840YMM9_9SPHN|nr:hydroxymethylbilane synthase [Sphingomonas xinjiangensis]MBB5711166.1 hydroxymethylbilane synthase [Sphingomonas xinjiangensis]
MAKFRIGTRGSPLALTQANMVGQHLVDAEIVAAQDVEIVTIRTTGDRVQDRALAEIGGKALWTKELDRALLAGDIDCAVHSMKDVETFRPDMIAIAATLHRADVRDRLIGADSIESLRQNAVIGTSSPRRAAQLRKIRPDLQIVLFRGNVETRLAKLAAGEVDATLLAAAGLARLGRDDVGTAIPINVMLPAPAQGIIGVECRADDAHSLAMLKAIDDPQTHACADAERAFLAALKADCHSPVAALATLEGGILTLRAELLSQDGAHHLYSQIEGAPLDPLLPRAVAQDLLEHAPPEIRRLFEG